MQIDQMKYFVSSVELESYSCAAKLLNVTPQTVAKSMKRLQAKLHVKLFVNKGKGIVPTKQAYAIYKEACTVVQATNNIISITKAMAVLEKKTSNISGTIRVLVASSPFEGQAVSTTTLSEYSSLHPDISLIVDNGSTTKCLTALNNGFVDACILFGRPVNDELEYTVLYHKRLDAVVSKQHPLSKRKEVSLQELSKYPFARPYDLGFSGQIVEVELKSRYIDIDHYESMTFIDEFDNYIHNLHGIGFAVHDKNFSSHYMDLVLIPLIKADFIEIPVCLITKRNSDQDKMLLATLQQHLRQNDK